MVGKELTRLSPSVYPIVSQKSTHLIMPKGIKRYPNEENSYRPR